MKYVIMIHSNPQPWGHPTAEHLPAFQALPEEQKRERNEAFETVFGELQKSGELISGQALGDPTLARLGRWDGTKPTVTDGPYAETSEHLAGFFLLDLATPERADEVVRAFTGPGETVELRPLG